jgi:UDPglucose 6-dehydrogenase
MPSARRYSVVGLGKLGASMAAAIADGGHHVVGVDVDQRAVDQINAGRAPVHETGLADLIAANTKRLRATTRVADAVAASDVTFVVVPTPSDERGAFSLDYARAAFDAIGAALAEKADYHLVVMCSTVLPGATRYGLLPRLEQHSGKQCGQDFGLCYSPEFIALGSVIRDFLNPDFTLVGESDERAGALLEVCYAEIMRNAPPCRRMSIENAELTKIAVNTFVTTKISFANMLADLCERIPGGDVDVVTQALGSDARIGRRYLTGALGYGGPCFPRDNVALGFIARQLEADAGIAETTDRMNRAIAARVAGRLDAVLPAGAIVGILGLAYKPASHVVDESQAIALARELATRGFTVLGYDPLAGADARRALCGTATVLGSMREVLAAADVVLVTTPDPEFAQLTVDDVRRPGGDVTVVDFWRTLAPTMADVRGIRYVGWGRAPDDDSLVTRLRQLWSEEIGAEARY